MIYTDGVHLMSDDVRELIAFANSLGLKRCWFQNHKRHPHYDLMSKRVLELALAKGAILLSSKEMLRAVKKN